MIAIVHSIYSQSVHALALNAGLMDNYADRYCICTPLLNPVMYVHYRFLKKSYDTKFLKGPLQFIKITLHWLHQFFAKTLRSRYLYIFLYEH